MALNDRDFPTTLLTLPSPVFSICFNVPMKPVSRLTMQDGLKIDIGSLPGVSRWSVDRLPELLDPLVEKGLKSVLLFGVVKVRFIASRIVLHHVFTFISRCF